MGNPSRLRPVVLSASPWKRPLFVVLFLALAYGLNGLPATANGSDVGVGAVPSVETTGVRSPVDLEASRSVVVDQEGAILEGLDVTGSIQVNADNVTIRNSRVNASNSLYGIKIARDVTGLVVEDTEINSAKSAAISYGQYTARRIDVHGSRDGLLVGSGTVITDSWVHDLSSSGEGIKSIGASNVVLSGNYVVAANTSGGAAVELMAKSSPVEGWLVEGNTFEGGQNTVRLLDRGQGFTAIEFRDNLWVSDSWSGGPLRVNGATPEWTGNFFSDGQPVPAPGGGQVDPPELPSPRPPIERVPGIQPTIVAPAPSTTPSGDITTTSATVPVPTVDPLPSPPETTQPPTTVPSSTTSTEQVTTTTEAPPLPSSTTRPVGGPLPTECTFTNPNDPSDDPNALHNGSRGRYPVSSNPVPVGYPTPLSTGLCGTGVKVSDLTPSDGLSITEDGAVVDRLDIDGTLNIRANNVTVRNSRITSSGRYALQLHDGFTGLTVEDTRIRSSGFETSSAVYLQGNATFRRTHITGGWDSMKATQGLLVEDSYIGANVVVPGTHNDVVQVRTGSGYTFRRNTMLGPWQQTTSVFLFQAKSGAGGGPISDVLIEDNYLSGGGYTIYTLAPDYAFTNGVIRNNRIENDSWRFGWKSDTAGANYSGNVLIPS